MRFDRKTTILSTLLVFGGMLAFTLGWVGPFHAGTAYQRGLRLLEQGRADAACRELTRAVDLAPQHEEYRLARARALRRAQNFDDARSDYEQVLLKNPSSKEAILGLSELAAAEAGMPTPYPGQEARNTPDRRGSPRVSLASRR